MTIYLTVTNDLSFDQRMIRICTSLQQAGHQIILVGREQKKSISLIQQPFRQKRISCFFNTGIFFYAEYNLRLFFYLLTKKMDCICAIDLDTILSCLFISKLKNTKRVYDAHELFCEMKEVVTRPAVYKIWKRIERFAVPQFKNCYTVNQPIAEEFKKLYGTTFKIVRNVPMLADWNEPAINEKYILYQGAVNEGRSFKTLIPAMKNVNCKLMICGDGNFMKQVVQLVKENNVADKIIFKGNIEPAALIAITQQATIGINLVENNGLSNYLSLANKFFDYIQAGIPQLCVGYPAYAEINNEFEVALLTNDLSSENLAVQLNNLLTNEVVYKTLQANCKNARLQFNWQNEEKHLIEIYDSIK